MQAALDHLAAGRIVERGRHEELLRAGGRYAALAARDAELEGLAVAGLAGAS